MSQAVVAKLDCEDKLAIGMRNTPQQYVLSGEREAVEAAVREIEDEFCAQSSVVDERLPMHSPLFRGVREKLGPVLEQARWRSPVRPYLPNVKGDFAVLSGSSRFCRRPVLPSVAAGAVERQHGEIWPRRQMDWSW